MQKSIIAFLWKTPLILIGMYIIIMIVSSAIDTPSTMFMGDRWSMTMAVDITMQNIFLVTLAYILSIYAIRKTLTISYKLAKVSILISIPLLTYVFGRLFGDEKWTLNFGVNVGGLFMMIFGFATIGAFIIDIVAFESSPKVDKETKAKDKKFFIGGIIIFLVFFVRMIYLINSL